MWVRNRFLYLKGLLRTRRADQGGVRQPTAWSPAKESTLEFSDSRGDDQALKVEAIRKRDEEMAKIQCEHDMTINKLMYDQASINRIRASLVRVERMLAQIEKELAGR